MGWFLYDNDPRHERVKFASNIKDINREKATSSAYKSTNMGICVVGTSNQLFIGGS